MDGTDTSAVMAAAMDHYGHQRLAEAEAACRSVVAADPKRADALHLLGVLSLERGNPAGAVAMVERAVRLRPGDAAAWNTLGECWRTMGRSDPALACYRTAIGLAPAMAAAHSNLGIVLMDAGEAEAAVEALRTAVAIDPGLAMAHNNLGTALRATGRLDEALASNGRAVALSPGSASAHNNAGSVLEALDRLPEALAAYGRAADLDPRLAVACVNALNVARQLCRWDEAVAWADRAMAADPSHAPAVWNRGLVRLTRGDYAGGLADYEWRFAGTGQRHPPFLTGPAWDGRDPAGRTVLVYVEQGLGDGFQAARYVPALAGRAGRVVVLCPPSQARLFARLPGVAAVVTDIASAGRYDCFAAMMSLPLLCGTRSFGDVPKGVPYLSAPPERVEHWRHRLGSAGPRVGLVWAGNPKPDPLRTVPLATLAPVLAVDGVRWFSLQVGPAVGELGGVAGGDRVVDLSADLTDFAETAAVMQNLDLVVTTDTATAHLAGALGRPTWTLVPFSPDWRWLLDRDDSPWYPTMRLFRQAERKQWRPVADRVAEELVAWVRTTGH